MRKQVQLFESKPRFKGALPHCLFANLPAAKDLKEMKSYAERYAPEMHVLGVWRCKKCKLIHWWSVGELSANSARATKSVLPKKIQRRIEESLEL